VKFFLCVIFGVVLGVGAAFLWLHEEPPAPEPPPARDPNLVATVGDLNLYVPELEAELVRRKSDDVTAVLEEMLERMAVVAKARDLGLHGDTSVKRKLGNVLIGEIRERELDPLLASVTVGEDDVKRFYDSHLEKYSKGQKIRLAILTKEYSERWSEKKRAAVLEGLVGLRKRAMEEPVTGKGFGALAIEGTEFQAARYKGGDVGWFTDGVPSRWPEKVVSRAFEIAEIGDMSDIIEADSRLFVVKLMDVREAALTPFSEVQGGLTHSLAIQAKKDAEREWWKAIRGSASVALHAAALERVKAPDNLRKSSPQVPPTLP
jgi:hypothetical protein